MANLRESSLQEQKAKAAKERARFSQDPPYMEMRGLTDDAYKVSVKENIPPSMRPRPQSLQAQHKGDGFGASLPLGEDYDRKKRQLQQELRQDYRRYVAQETSRQRKEKKDQGVMEPGQHLGLSLPIGERKSAKDKLRIERNHEYNQFLRGLGEKVRAVQVSDADPHSDQHQPSRKDAATLTEAERRPLPGVGGNRGPDKRTPRPPRNEDDSGMDFSESEWDHLVKRRPRVGRQPGRAETRGRRARTPDRDAMGGLENDAETWPHPESRIPQARRRHQTPDVPDEETADDGQNLAPATPKNGLRVPAEASSTGRSGVAGSGVRVQFATGLLIGTTKGEMTMQKKERYRQELLEQIAEQQRNRRREKEMGLKVAATGAVDPEKQPDRIKQFGPESHDQDGTRNAPDKLGLGIRNGNSAGRPTKEKPPLETKEMAPPARPRIAFQSPLLDYSAALEALVGTGAGRTGTGLGLLAQSEDLHKNLSSTLGAIAASQVPSVPPPAPPTVAEAYKTPFDEAYFYYGARNPLDLGSAFGGPAGGGAHAVPFLTPEHPQGQLGHAESGAQAAWQSGPVSSDGDFATLPGRAPRRSKESVISYQDALRQQIQEREESRRQEEAERERYEARMEAEMKAYNPWGKGGGGAPLKDHQGNLLTDLKRMNRSNKEAYVNPGSQDREAAGNVPTPQGQDEAPSDRAVPGCSHASPFARGNVFADLPTPQQLQEQERYKDILRQQIEEKRRREAEEQERLRLEDEREERRLAEQRARIQREYEEEQERRRRKEQEQMARNDELVRQAEQRRREAERRKCEEEERLGAALREQHERERRARLEEVHRDPSPPIPTLQNQLASRRAMPPPSADTPRSASVLSESSVAAPAPPSPPVPAHRNQQRAKEEHPGVVRELSALRRQLRSKQRVLEEQLQQRAEHLESPGSVRLRERPPVDVFGMARMRQQAPVRRPMNLQNIHDFNQLKYRDGESREELRRRYPDPPTDERSLEIQQQALLREQQRRTRRPDAAGSGVPLTQRPGPPPTMGVAANAVRGSPLQSHSLFLEPNESIMPDAYEWEQNAPSRPGEEMHLVKRRGSGPRRPREVANRDDFASFQQTSDRVAGRLDPSSPCSGTRLNIEQINEQNRRRIRALEELHRWERGLSTLSDEGADLSLRVPQSPLDRRFSIDTVATEPWLRPGTSDTVMRRVQSGIGFRKASLPSWEGPSTYHG